MIRAQNLRKSFESIVAVDDLSLDIDRGSTFGLLGPNGAGKSTTIHMLVGALKPDDGNITINGNSDPTQAYVRRDIGIAPQQISLYDDLTCEENLAFFGRLYGVCGARLKERINWSLDFARLAERRKSLIKTYSGGMLRRLNLAVALLPDPQIVLCDEPTAGVDPQSRNHIFEIIEALRSEGRTILYTTHYMEEAQRLCDRVAIMDHGKILAVDTVDGLINQYGHGSVVTAHLEHAPIDGHSLPGTLKDHELRFESKTPLEELLRLSNEGYRFSRFQVNHANLESVFLSLTGRSLRD